VGKNNQDCPLGGPSALASLPKAKSTPAHASQAHFLFQLLHLSKLGKVLK
jgi:hypothetical protein